MKDIEYQVIDKRLQEIQKQVNELRWVISPMTETPSEDKAVLITRKQYAKACEEADKDQHKIGVSGTFFERVCHHLGI